MDLSSLLTPMNITLIILFIAAFFFMQGKVRSDLVAICALLALVIFDILSPTEALAGFSNSVVIMMVGLFVVGAGIFRTGLAKMISSKILHLAGNNENKLFVLIMLVTASIGAFVSNTGTVAVMMPIIISMAASANINSRRYLMPLAFASSMGMFTLISTPPNLVINNALIEAGYDGLAFFSFAPIGFVALSVGIIVLFFLTKFLVTKNDTSGNKKKQGKSLIELAQEYQLQQQSYRIEVRYDSPLLSKNLKELRIATNYDVSITKIVRKVGNSRFRKNVVEEVAGPKSTILKDDILYCHGDLENIERFVSENNLFFERVNDKEPFSDFQESGIAEIFVMPNSRLINRTISEIRFREEYNVNVLGIQRQNEYKMQDIKDTKLHSGDALLIQGTWKDLANLDERQDDLVLVGQPLKEASKVTLDQKAPIAAIIMLLMILAMVFEVLPSVIAIMLAAVLMVATGCLRNVEEAYNSINWESIVLIGAMLPMATAFQNTGVDTLISGSLVGQLGDMGPYALLAGIYFCTSLLTMFISNTATAVLFTPIALKAAIGMGVSPYPFLFAVAVAASMCFASPFSTPPNALVMSAGRYSFMDYVKVGLPLQIIMGIIMIMILPLLFPF
ncbi:di/tricarboxylate transporter [Dysgonomonas sp. PFB1-18]|nr:di/tricarboxylate transporter [Dysgonomonas sp. PF1-14]MDH6338265.1 di/tricarboxylate transporter [Dysgonomonas sp. PF1-16]MDH6379762.1 di/tricarboxylate transporter [Dysgonomonas sp. PFB1-18]MDH6397148.1 di/tricarboxylate transporter [Dysgonomonas sp. PF1-23]